MKIGIPRYNDGFIYQFNKTRESEKSVRKCLFEFQSCYLIFFLKMPMWRQIPERDVREHVSDSIYLNENEQPTANMAGRMFRYLK